MSGTVDLGLKAVIDQSVKRRQDYLARLRSGSSVVKITYRGKELLCVYLRHTKETITVQTSKEIIDYLFNNGTLCIAGPFTEIVIKFKLGEIEIADG